MIKIFPTPGRVKGFFLKFCRSAYKDGVGGYFKPVVLIFGPTGAGRRHAGQAKRDPASRVRPSSQPLEKRNGVGPEFLSSGLYQVNNNRLSQNKSRLLFFFQIYYFFESIYVIL